MNRQHHAESWTATEQDHGAPLWRYRKDSRVLELEVWHRQQACIWLQGMNNGIMNVLT